MKWFLKALKQYADFSGRARRREYWYFHLFQLIFWLVLLLISSIFLCGTSSHDMPQGMPQGTVCGGNAGILNLISWIYLLAMLIPSIAVGVRRLHDIGKSGWFLLLYFVPIVGWIVLLIWACWDSEAKSNKWGTDPKGKPATAKTSTQSNDGNNFRLDAIKNLKATGKPFDEFDLELETEKLKKEHDEHLAQKTAEQEKEQAQIFAEQEKKRQEKKRVRTKKTIIAIVCVILLSVLLYFTINFIYNRNESVEKSVVINGVRWATRNVDTPGTFTRNVTDFGGYFTWEEAIDACPPGWRLPHIDELERLVEASMAVGRTIPKVDGFGIIGLEIHQLFLPAGGFWELGRGHQTPVCWQGNFWSANWDRESPGPHIFSFNPDGHMIIHDNIFERWHMLSVRCVAE